MYFSSKRQIGYGFCLLALGAMLFLGAAPAFAASCEEAQAILGGEYTGTTTGQSSDGESSCGRGAGSPDVFYSYMATADGTLTVGTCESEFDTVLSLHSGCPATIENELACNDDSPLCGGTGSQLSYVVEAGTAYILRVSGRGEDSGSYSLRLEHSQLEVRNSLGSYATYNEREISGVRVDTSDASFLAHIDFDRKADCDREVIWKSGGSWSGSSLCYEAPNTLVLRTVSGRTRLATARFKLPNALVAAGNVEVAWVFDVDATEDGDDVIALLVEGHLVAGDIENLRGDWAGSTASDFGSSTSCLPADGNGDCLAGGDFVSGTIDLAGGLNFYFDTVYSLPELDEDGDGLSDSFERVYSPGNPGHLGEGDADRDGVSDREEMEAGTDPTDAGSTEGTLRAITIPEVEARPGEIFTVPVTIDETEGLASFRIEVAFDSELLSVVSDGVRTGEAFTRLGQPHYTLGNFLADGSLPDPGHLIVAGITAFSADEGPGVFLEIDFQISEDAIAGDRVLLNIEGIRLNEGELSLGAPSTICEDPADGILVVLPPDSDGDDVGDPDDNCIEVSNADQADVDEDGIGDLCDVCPGVSDPGQADGDHDGAGDACDNCLDLANEGQADLDEDEVGDSCDNCPLYPNPDQADRDEDEVGDACTPPSFTLEFSEVSEQTGCVGDNITAEAVCILATTDNITDEGAAAFSFGVNAEGGSITDISTEGSDAAGLIDNGFELTQLTSGGGNEGAICGIILSFEQNITLPGNGSSSLATISIQSTISDDGNVELTYVDDLVGRGIPIRNSVTWRGLTVAPSLGNATYSLVPDTEVPSAPGNLLAVEGEGRSDQ